MSLEHVPAPQLASPAGAAFGDAAFLVPAVGDLPAGAAPGLAGDAVEGAGATGAVVAVVDAATGAAEGVVGDAAPVGGAAALVEAAAGESDFAADALPEQALAEQDA